MCIIGKLRFRIGAGTNAVPCRTAQSATDKEYVEANVISNILLVVIETFQV
jgi:hypothetical protein